jgi:hypothetical protein
MDEPPAPRKPPKAAMTPTGGDRLAEALRANLARRKAQARARATAPDERDPDPDADPNDKNED